MENPNSNPPAGGQNPKENGFTIVEMVVVMTIFLFIIGVVIAIFISVVENQRAMLAQQKLVNQLSYAQEYMSKALRMAKADNSVECLDDGQGGSGYVYLLTRPDITSGLYRGIKFVNQSDNDTCQEFFLDTTNPEHPILKVLKNSSEDADAVALTSSGLKITSMAIAINGVPAAVSTEPVGATNQDGIQPRLTIAFSLEIQSPGGPVSRIIQTTISQRNLNVQP